MNLNPKFYVVLLNHNNYDYTKDCIDSLQTCTYANIKILVVDDCSSDRSIDNLLFDYPDVEFIQNIENLHYCKSFNVGIRHALSNGADYIFLVNNDTKDFSANYFEVVLSEFKSDYSIGMVGSKCIDYVGGVRRDEKASIRFGLSMDTPTEGYVIKADVFRKIGGLNEFLIIYMEDLDFIVRMRSAGFKTKINTDISFAHMGGVATSKRPYYSTYLRTRNIVLFARKIKRLDSRSKFWMMNEIRANLMVTIVTSLRLCIRFELRKSLGLSMGLFTGIISGSFIDLEKAWSQENCVL